MYRRGARIAVVAIPRQYPLLVGREVLAELRVGGTHGPFRLAARGIMVGAPPGQSKLTERRVPGDDVEAFRLDSGDALILDGDHPLRIVSTESGPSPRLLVRHGLEAELARPVYYELAQIVLSEGSDPPGIWSEGVFFRLDGSE